MKLGVTELAREAGVSPHTVRYYDRVGLLRKPERSAAGYRRYEAQDGERIKLIRGAQRVGLRLSDIRQLLDVLDKGRCPCGHTERVLKERLAEVEEEIARRGAVRSELLRFLRQFPVECERPEDWPCRDELIQIGRR